MTVELRKNQQQPQVPWLASHIPLVAHDRLSSTSNRTSTKEHNNILEPSNYGKLIFLQHSWQCTHKGLSTKLEVSK